MLYKQITNCSKEAISLLSLAVGSPTNEKLAKIIKEYAAPNSFLRGAYDNNKLVGLVGFHIDQDILILKHIAISPSCQGRGIGKWLVKETIKEFQPQKILAETDLEAVNFYNNLGFEITPFKGLYGIRYKCLLKVSEYP